MKHITIKDQAEATRLCFKEAQNELMAARLNAASTTLLSLTYMNFQEVIDVLDTFNPGQDYENNLKHIRALETMKQLVDYIKNGQSA